MVTITRRYEFDAAHRIANHPKCGNIHGHRYAVEVTVTGERDERGLIMDFADIDAALGKWINDNLDHAFLVHSGERCLKDYIGKTFPIPSGTSVENIATLIFRVAREVLPVQVVNVRVYETPRAWADADLA